MKDQTKVCWNCGSRNMSPVETWFKCDDCGATTDSVHNPGYPKLIWESALTPEERGQGYSSHYKPSPGIMSKATRARKEAQERAEALAKHKG